MSHERVEHEIVKSDTDQGLREFKLRGPAKAHKNCAHSPCFIWTKSKELDKNGKEHGPDVPISECAAISPVIEITV